MKPTYVAILAYGAHMSVVARGSAVQVTMKGTNRHALAMHNWLRSGRRGMKPKVHIARITNSIG